LTLDTMTSTTSTVTPKCMDICTAAADKSIEACAGLQYQVYHSQGLLPYKAL
jgi:hypothetical protein